MSVDIVKQQRGHLATCPFTNNFSPACSCDGVLEATPEGLARRSEIHNALTFGGWQCGDGMSWPWMTFYLKLVGLRGEQYVMLHRVTSGWQFLWGQGYRTFAEEGSFGTPEACLTSLWKCIAELREQYSDLAIAAAKRSAHAGT